MQRLKLVILCEQCKIVLVSFPKAKTGIKADRVGVQAELGEFHETLLEKVSDVIYDVLILRVYLHGLRVALHMHDHHTGMILPCDCGHLFVPKQAADIIDDDGSGVQALLGDFGLHRVNADGDS